MKGFRLSLREMSPKKWNNFFLQELKADLMFLTCKQIQKFNEYDAKNPYGISVFLSRLQRWSL